jgi:SAM-dependent methyltransferase
MKADWHITRDDGDVLYDDEADHVALVLRTLRIDEATFRRVLAEYAGRCDDSSPHLDALAAAYAVCSPHEVSFSPAHSEAPCPACHAIAVEKIVARRATDEMRNGDQDLVYGRCAECGHGMLLSTAAPQSLYQHDAYYTERGAGGAGYENYERERLYRETKGGQLLDWIETAAGRAPRSLLEVGSGYGFTRRAAELRGIPTAGVDLSPHAAESARRLYGFDTFRGTLEQFLAAQTVGTAWDVVLYQFVMEHLDAPDAELRVAARAVAPGGYLAIVVPSMDAIEIEIFGASYRSFRNDHLHIFSHRSMELYLAGAGFVPVAIKTDCNLHLLRGFVSERALREIYESGKGPDMFVLARRV